MVFNNILTSKKKALYNEKVAIFRVESKGICF